MTSWGTRLISRAIKYGLLKFLNNEVKIILMNKTESLGVEKADLFISYSESYHFFR